MGRRATNLERPNIGGSCHLASVPDSHRAVRLGTANSPSPGNNRHLLDDSGHRGRHRGIEPGDHNAPLRERKLAYTCVQRNRSLNPRRSHATLVVSLSNRRGWHSIRSYHFTDIEKTGPV